MANETTGRLFTELEHMDDREAQIHGALLRRLAALEQRDLRSRNVTVADLQTLKVALDEMQATLATAQAAAVTPTAEIVNGTATATVPALTLAQLDAQIRDHDATARRVRELLAERLQTLAPAAPAEQVGDHDHDHVHGATPPGVRRARTFRLQRPLMKGADVRAFQGLLNRRYAAWGIAKRIAENGTYGPQTREAAQQVAFCLGLSKADYEQGITPAVRVVLRTPSRRTARQLQRAGERNGHRATLRKQHATARRARAVSPSRKANGNGSHGGGGALRVAGDGGLATAIRAHGGRYEDIIVREAKRFGVPVALVCAVVDMESSFANVYGHDTVRNPIKSPAGGVREVTAESYREYLRHRRLGEGSQGVGPMQLTHFSLQDEADAAGGCHRPEINIRVGVKHLAKLIDDFGLQIGVQRYNGAKGHAYSDEVLKRRRAWDARLDGASSPDPAKPPVSRPGDRGPLAPRTFKLTREPMRGADVKRFQGELNQRFADWGIARRIPEDGVYGPDTRRAGHQVTIALGIAASAYEQGITPRLRMLIRTPSRRSAGDLRRARDRGDYRAKLRTRYGSRRAGKATVGGSPASVSGSPKAIIDEIVVPIARRCGIAVTARSVEQSNAAHSLNTTSGNRSDHKGPPNVSWAADMSNGGSPTREMDRLAAALAKRFGIPWSGSGLVSHNAGAYRYQLIYRTNAGGNHFNHVHLGVKKR